MAMRNQTVVLAVVITAAISVIVAVIVLYFFNKLMMRRRLKKAVPDSSFRRDDAATVPRIEFRQHGGALRGLIVDEEGMDVLYLRKFENGHFPRCFSKVWHNPMDEEVKRMNSREEKPCVSDHIQEIPLLQEPRNEYVSELKKPPPPPPPPPPPAPPPPPPPPLPPRTLPQKGNLKPAPPPPPVKTRGQVSSHKPPIPLRGTENRHKGKEDSDKESMKGNVGRMKLKPLHWDKVTANADDSMVWNEINDGSFRVDDDLMESLFGYTTTSQKTIERSSKLSRPHSLPPSQMFLLDPRKSQNTAIVLKSLSISRGEILDALLVGRGLNTDTLEKLTKICPTQEEITNIIQFNGNPTKLADAESFLYHILKAVPSAFIRFNAMLFRSTYDQEILNLKESLQTLELGCKELRNGGIFFKLLEAILKAGNKMNAGTTRGNAQGFNLTALHRLSDVKSTDGKITLLHFVVEQVIRAEGKRCMSNKNLNSGNKNHEVLSETKGSNEEKDEEHLNLGLPVVESLNTEFANVKKAACVDYDSLISMCSVLTRRVDEITHLLNRCKDIESDGFVREMKGFLEDCREELNVVREEEKRVLELVRKTTAYYQAEDRGGNPLHLFVIVKDFLKNVDQVCAEIRKKLQKGKVGTSAGSSPPLSPTSRSPRFQNLQVYFRAQRFGTSSSDSEDDF